MKTNPLKDRTLTTTAADNSETDPKESVLESAPESERWDPLPGSTGHKVPATASEDEDDEGRSDNEQLVEEGAAQAEEDRMLQAEREAAEDDE